jgi:hypothetical protein
MEENEHEIVILNCEQDTFIIIGLNMISVPANMVSFDFGLYKKN